MSAHPESNGHDPHLVRLRTGALEFDGEIGIVETSLENLEASLVAEIERNSQVFRSYPYSRFEAALNGEMTPRDWVSDLAHHVDTYLLPD
jgi:hypothetical protein